MISRLGLVISRAFERTAPDPFVIAILLTIVTAGLALLFGQWRDEQGVGDRALALLDSWRFRATDDSGQVIPAASRIGIWKLLEFSMQMCLILVTGHALAVTRPIRALIDMVARVPRSTAGAAAMVSTIACAAALINWGLGLIVGALLAREVGSSLHRRGVRAHYPLICAAGYMGLMIWHGGLSGSAPLTMTTRQGAAGTLPPLVLARLDEHAQAAGLGAFAGVPLSQTIFAPMNLFVTIGLLAIIPLLYIMLAPRREADMRSMEECGVTLNDIRPGEAASRERPASSLPDRLDRAWLVVWLLAVPLILALARFASTSGWDTIGLNEINAGMLALGLVLHGSPRSYMAAAEHGARGCAGIIIQFPLYAGIMAMMSASGLVESIAQWFTAIGTATTIPFFSFLSACVINLFIPSGGGQWAVQGPIALQMALGQDIAPGKLIMSVAYGDQLTNMLQPFWALPLLAITGVRARDIVGYTATVMLLAGAWIALGLLIF